MRWFAPILLLGPLSLSACRSSTEPSMKAKAPNAPNATVASAASSSAVAAVVSPPAELGVTMRVAARVRNRNATLYREGPKDVRLDAGVFVYAALDGGPLERVGDVSDHAKDVGEDIVGPAAGAPSRALRTQEHEEEIAYDADGTSVTLRNVTVDLGAGPHESCVLVPSADGHVYATCRHGEIPLILRTPNAWVRVGRADVLKLPTEPRLAVARDGAIWAWEDGSGLTRILPDGRREKIALPRAPEELARPTYDGSYPEMMSATWARGADGNVRFWQSTKIASARPPTDIAAIARLVPQGDGSMWLLGWEGGGTDSMVVMRTSSRGAPAPLEIGTPFDQENEVRNARPARPWSTRCPQVFVAFDVGAHEKEATEALQARKHRINVDVISGRLGGREESGVLFLRSEPESSPAALEAAVARLLLVPRAEAFCTAPVVHRILRPQ